MLEDAQTLEYYGIKRVTCMTKMGSAWLSSAKHCRQKACMTHRKRAHDAETCNVAICKLCRRSHLLEECKIQLVRRPQERLGETGVQGMENHASAPCPRSLWAGRLSRTLLLLLLKSVPFAKRVYVPRRLAA